MKRPVSIRAVKDVGTLRPTEADSIKKSNSVDALQGESMPLTQQDVLDTLNSYFVTQMDFWIDRVHVCARNYNSVRTLIENGDIPVAEGTASNAYYNPQTDVLTTQAGTPPPDLEDRALLVHECTHAIVDVEKYDITRLTNEVVAYVAQHTYLLLANPNYKVPPNNPPWFNFFNDVVALVKKFKLHQPAGRGAVLGWDDYKSLRTELNSLNIYSHVTDRERSFANGVPVSTDRGRFGSPPVSFRSSSHEVYPEASDESIMKLLEVRYAAKDVAGFGGRIATLEQMFSHMEKVRAKALLLRLQTRIAGDKMSVYFHDHLMGASRTKLLNLLRLR